MRRRLYLSMVAALALSGSLWAHGDGPHYMGTVTAVDAGHIEVKTRDGKIVSLKLDAGTNVLRGDTAAALEDVKIGERVVVHLGGPADDLVVLGIHLGTRRARPQPGDDHHHIAQEHGHEGKQGGAHAEHQEHEGMSMESGPLGLPESRAASGTSWQPDSTPMHGVHFGHGSWMMMAHTNVFAGYDHQGSVRGDSQWISPNWGMLMEKRSLGEGELILRQMLSLEPLTVRPKGYPLLLQTGESFQGAPIHDRQHPHDLFMELAASYTRTISDSLAVQLYAAPVGEPALGPVAFPHRFSAFSDPLAPLGHHWLDSTHISFGVFTGGLMSRKFKVEASWFNGREPDEHRYDFDFRGLDSYSGRVWFNPSDNWSFQTSYGYLASPEKLESDESVHRVTASAAYNRKVGSLGSVATTAAFGRNDPSGHPATSSWLLEANYDTGTRSTLFGRAEHTRKSGRDLALPSGVADDEFAITSLVAGYVYKLASAKHVVIGIGARVSVNLIESDLESFYGTKKPAGYMIFLHLHPVELASHSMQM